MLILSIHISCELRSAKYKDNLGCRGTHREYECSWVTSQWRNLCWLSFQFYSKTARQFQKWKNWVQGQTEGRKGGREEEAEEKSLGAGLEGREAEEKRLGTRLGGREAEEKSLGTRLEGYCTSN